MTERHGGSRSVNTHARLKHRATRVAVIAGAAIVAFACADKDAPTSDDAGRSRIAIRAVRHTPAHATVAAQTTLDGVDNVRVLIARTGAHAGTIIDTSMAFSPDAGAQGVALRVDAIAGDVLAVTLELRLGAVIVYTGSASVTASPRGFLGQPVDVFVFPVGSEAGRNAVFAQISAGGYQTCALTAAGKAYCWGRNDHGQLGDGTRNDYPIPKAVSGALVFQSISTGGDGAIDHVCGLTVGGQAYCWGSNTYGQLGDNTVTSRLVPTAVAGPTFASVVASRAHSCALTNAGAAYCWGYNGTWGVGDSTTVNRAAPTPVRGNHAFVEIAVGGWISPVDHSCGRTAAGAVYCWGYNSSGQIGDSTVTVRGAPTLVRGAHQFTAITAGGAHTCGLRTDGRAYCWGENGGGQLGDGTLVDRRVPTAVSTNLTFVELEAGSFHTCGRTQAGSAHCWGTNSNAQLGDGTSVRRTTPTPVSGGHTFVDITGGYSHTCGRTAQGFVYCWGYPGYALGVGPDQTGYIVTHSIVPVAVARPE